MQTTSKQPYVICFRQIGDEAEGYLSVAEFERDLPFAVRRAFWTYQTPGHVIRGRHAHHRTEMVLVAVAGKIEVRTEVSGGKTDVFLLDRPDQGLYLPPLCWHTMQYSPGAVQLVLASTPYAAEDYIRDYEIFKAIAG